jgi:hypothetical protein
MRLGRVRFTPRRAKALPAPAGRVRLIPGVAVKELVQPLEIAFKDPPGVF